MGRHASGRSSRGPIALLVTLLVLSIVGWISYTVLVEQLGVQGCDSQLSINVTAAPDIAPVVKEAARKAAESESEDCYRVRVTSVESEQAAESLVLSAGADPPDVWIPESTMWLQRAQDKGAWDVPVTGTSIATSPVVLALTDDAATRLGWPDEEPTWGKVLGSRARGFTVGIADPARDPAGLSALTAVRRMASKAADASRAYTAMLRRMSPNAVEETTELFAQLPGRSDGGEPLDAFPASELEVLRHNVQSPNPDLVAAYAQPSVPSLDFPYIVIPGTDPARRKAAASLLNRLLADDMAKVFADAGLRTAQGRALRDRSKDQRITAEAVPGATVPPPAEVRGLLNEWAGVNLSARIQVLLDVSGSMAESVPGTGKTRMSITLEAAEAGLRLFKGSTKVGLWLYSTNQDGEKPYRQLLPVRPVREHLDGDGLQTLRSVGGQIGGGTGTYDTVLAAYRDATKHWEAGRINVVVILTDGKNDNRSGTNLDTLRRELGKLRDPRRPLQIIGIGIGPDVDPTELRAISEPTGGEVFTTADPTKIIDVFYAALAKLLCQPPACKPDSGK